MGAIDRYTTVAQEAAVEFVEKKSRFISAIRPVTTEEEALAFLAEKRTAFWDASHNCYAYILRESGIQRYSDAGEPQGTAGVPILEVLRKEGLCDVVVVVTRYFGGTLLGAGGLVRAYSHSAKLAVDAAGRLQMRTCTLISINMPYPLYGRLSTLLQTVQVLDCVFAEDVTLRLRLASDELPRFTAQLTEMSGGTVLPEILGEEFAKC